MKSKVKCIIIAVLIGLSMLLSACDDLPTFGNNGHNVPICNGCLPTFG